MRNCCIVGCKNSTKHKTLDGRKAFRFFTIPKNWKVRQLWLEKINRDNFTPSKFTSVCSKHFVDEEPTLLHPIPSLNMECSTSMKRHEGNRRKSTPRRLARKKTSEVVKDGLQAIDAAYINDILLNTESVWGSGSLEEHGAEANNPACHQHLKLLAMMDSAGVKTMDPLSNSTYAPFSGSEQKHPPAPSNSNYFGPGPVGRVDNFSTSIIDPSKSGQRNKDSCVKSAEFSISRLQEMKSLQTFVTPRPTTSDVIKMEAEDTKEGGINPSRDEITDVKIKSEPIDYDECEMTVSQAINMTANMANTFTPLAKVVIKSEPVEEESDSGGFWAPLKVAATGTTTFNLVDVDVSGINVKMQESKDSYGQAISLEPASSSVEPVPVAMFAHSSPGKRSGAPSAGIFEIQTRRLGAETLSLNDNSVNNDDSETIPSKVSLKRSHSSEEENSSDELRCVFCDFTDTNQSIVDKHMKTHAIDNAYWCPYCNYKAMGLGILVIHIRVHTGEKPFKCSHCDYRSAYKFGLKSHMGTHSKEKPFKCLSCDFKSSYKSSLSKHMKNHATVRMCRFCDYSCTSKAALYAHEREHVKKASTAECKDNFQKLQDEDKITDTCSAKVAGAEKQYKCSLCGFSCISAVEIQEHAEAHCSQSLLTSSESSSSESKTSAQSCQLLESKSKEKTNIDNDSLSDMGTGDSSSRKLNDIQSNSNSAQAHSVKRPHKCSICDFSSAYKENLREHMKSHDDSPSQSGMFVASVINMVDRPYKCSLCSYSSAYRDSLRQHMEAGHASVAPFVSAQTLFRCSVCDFTSGYRYSLKQHMETHAISTDNSNNIPSYKCSLCPYSSANKEELRKHGQKHRTEVSNSGYVKRPWNKDRKYKCSLCNFTSGYKENLRDHIRTHSENEIDSS